MILTRALSAPRAAGSKLSHCSAGLLALSTKAPCPHASRPSERPRHRPAQPPPAATPRCRRPVRNRSVPLVHSASKPSRPTARTRPTASSPTGVRRDRQQPPRGAAPPDAPLANHPPTNSPSAQRVSRRPPGNAPPKLARGPARQQPLHRPATQARPAPPPPWLVLGEPAATESPLLAPWRHGVRERRLRRGKRQGRGRKRGRRGGGGGGGPTSRRQGGRARVSSERLHLARALRTPLQPPLRRRGAIDRRGWLFRTSWRR